MKFVNIEELNFSLGKEIKKIGKNDDISIKILNSVNGVSDNELVLDILREIRFGILGKFGLLVNRLVGNILRVEPFTTTFDNFLAKDYLSDLFIHSEIETIDNDKESSKEEITIDTPKNYDNIEIYGVERNKEIIGIIIFGGKPEEGYKDISDMKVAIYDISKIGGDFIEFYNLVNSGNLY